MEGAEEELERRSMFLKSLIQKKKAIEQQEQHDHLHNDVRIRACDMPLPVQNRAFRCARDILDSMPGKSLIVNVWPWPLRRNLILRMVQLGTVLWVLALAPMLLILLAASCIFPLTRFISFSSRQLLNH